MTTLVDVPLLLTVELPDSMLYTFWPTSHIAPSTMNVVIRTLAADVSGSSHVSGWETGPVPYPPGASYPPGAP